MHWLIEPGVFSPRYRSKMSAAIQAAGHTMALWNDAWWTNGLPHLEGPVLFHGSLNNAARIAAERPEWRPGAYCEVAAFRCSAWYPRAARWLLQRPWAILPASALVADPGAALSRLGGVDEVFVRPDSPLKPFSGRVLPADGLTLEALDHGFYYDDPDLPVVVAPTRAVGREWRFVVADREVITGSGYIADGRATSEAEIEPSVRRFAAEIATEVEPPERVYVLDVCETDEGLRLMEFNPFSGADLYGCDLDAVIQAVAGSLAET